MITVFPFEVCGCPAAPVGPLAPVELVGLAVDRRAQRLVADAEAAHQVLVDHQATAAGERAHRELFPVRHAELANQEDVERRPQRRRDLPADRHAAARQPENQQVISARGRPPTPARTWPASRRSRKVRLALRRASPLHPVMTVLVPIPGTHSAYDGQSNSRIGLRITELDHALHPESARANRMGIEYESVVNHPLGGGVRLAHPARRHDPAGTAVAADDGGRRDRVAGRRPRGARAARWAALGGAARPRRLSTRRTASSTCCRRRAASLPPRLVG